MTTEHVSVPRKLANAAYTAFLECDLWKYADELQAILSRATPSDELQGAFAECYINENALVALRDPEIGIACVSRAKTNYSTTPLFLHQEPSAPRVVTDSDVDRAVDTVDAHYCRHDMVTKTCARIILESFATSLPAAIPPGYVVVPIEPTEGMIMAASNAAHDVPDHKRWMPAAWRAALAAAPPYGSNL